MKKMSLKIKKQREKPSILTIILFVFLVIYIVGLFIPIIWSIYGSMRNPTGYGKLSNTNYIQWFDSEEIQFLFSNYVNAFKNIKIVRNDVEFNYISLFGNSLLYSFGCAFFYTLSPLLTAYAAARFKFKFSGILYAFVLIAMSLPIVGAMPSEMKVLSDMGIFDTFFGTFVLKFNFISIYFFILYAQFQSIPYDYSEAAKIDGASNFKIMWRIIIPQAIGTITTVFLLCFINFWNDYSTPRVYLQSYPTIAETIQIIATSGQINGGQLTHTPEKIAAAVVVTIPIVIVFIILNRRLRVNVAMGGIKG